MRTRHWNAGSLSRAFAGTSSREICREFACNYSSASGIRARFLSDPNMILNAGNSSREIRGESSCNHSSASGICTRSVFFLSDPHEVFCMSWHKITCSHALGIIVQYIVIGGHHIRQDSVSTFRVAVLQPTVLTNAVQDRWSDAAQGSEESREWTQCERSDRWDRRCAGVITIIITPPPIDDDRLTQVLAALVRFSVAFDRNIWHGFIPFARLHTRVGGREVE